MNLIKNHRRIFVIGDIHGCYAELSLFIDHIFNSEELSDKDTVVFLGDYVDRGPDSKSVIQALIDFKKHHSNAFFLRGNHELMLSELLMEKFSLRHFLHNGGMATIRSYCNEIEEGSPHIVDMFVDTIPMDHIEFLEDLDYIVEFDKFICVHAGLNPELSLSDQREEDICWIRDPFINYPHNFCKTVIFGHTPWQNVFADLPYKVGIDTGLVFGNKLTCIELREGKVYQIVRGSNKILLSKIRGI